MKPSVVVFDLGGVLIDWQKHLAWIDDLGSREAVDAFLARVDFSAKNLRGDGGALFSELAEELDDAEDRALLANYPSRFDRTIQGKIAGTWDILHRLKTASVPLHAISNWSAETWPVAVKTHPELGQVFGVTVISGEERMLKPQREIFDTLCQRANVAAHDCVFIDDSPKNVVGAKAAGMDAIQFTDPEALESALQDRGLL
ncbi:MAG: HAD family hydrolase [Pelagimonas sp.]|uniref:HAD family hydrolase n=1 Tax=Pelagimonas sp. TaxID=2073170 RepID=UPI003D6C30CF